MFPPLSGFNLGKGHRGFQNRAILSVGRTCLAGTLHVNSTHSPKALIVDAESATARAVADVDSAALSVGGGWSRATEQFDPCRASTDIACHLAIVGDKVGVVSVTAALRTDAMAAEDEAEDEVDDKKLSATDSAATPSPSPVNKKEGLVTARASWTSFMFGYPARTP